MPQGGTATPLAPHFVQRAVEGLRYIISGVTPATWFGPLQPLPPQAPPEVGGRQFDYPVGYNLAIAPRSDEPISFAQLRALADGYDLLRTVIETRKDQLERLRWRIRRSDLGDGKPRNRDDDPRIAAIEAFLRMPDRVNFWSTWLRQLLEDLFVADAPTLYLRRNRGGQLHALEIVDGTTIKRLIDADGRTPEPPDPAYQQVLHGLPAADFTTRELIYRPRNPRPHKLYGYSPVEQIVMTVNIALRRQLHQLAYYTEGNVPEALIGTPESWTPPQIKEFQQYWDALLEGNLAQRRHAKFVPGGVAKTFIPTRDAELKGAFDEWLARIVCFAFSISPHGFLAQMNRATAETAQQAALSEGLAPIQNWVKQLIDHVLITEFAAPDLEFSWRDEREIDPQQAASVAQIYVTNGIKTVNEARSDLGLDPVEGGDVALVFTGAGPVPLAKAGAGAAPAAPAQRMAHASTLAKYSADQLRDERGRWATEGGTVRDPLLVPERPVGAASGLGIPRPEQVAQVQPQTMSDARDVGEPTPNSDDASSNVQIAADESDAARAMRAMPAMGAARAMAAARNPAAAGSLLRPILDQNPAEYANSRAAFLQSALPSRTQNSVTMAVGVVEDAQGMRSVVIASSESDRALLRPSVAALRQPNEIVVPPGAPGRHAEIAILEFARAKDLRLIAVGAGRPYCAECAPALDSAGVLATGPRN